jgi:hypothetical protein
MNPVAGQKKVWVPASFGPAVPVWDPILALGIELRVGAIDLRATHPMLSSNAQQALAFDHGVRFELRSPLMRLLSVLLLEPAKGVLPSGLRSAQIVLPWHRRGGAGHFCGHAPYSLSPLAKRTGRCQFHANEHGDDFRMTDRQRGYDSSVMFRMHFLTQLCSAHSLLTSAGGATAS